MEAEEVSSSQKPGRGFDFDFDFDTTLSCQSSLALCHPLFNHSSGISGAIALVSLIPLRCKAQQRISFPVSFRRGLFFLLLPRLLIPDHTIEPFCSIQEHN
jgi:hypothetical protein